MKSITTGNGSPNKKSSSSGGISLWMRGLSAFTNLSHESSSSLAPGAGDHHHKQHHGDKSEEDGEHDHHHKNKVTAINTSAGGVLTMEAVQSIQEVSPLQAWEKQPVSGSGDGRHKRKGESSRVAKFHDNFDGK